MKNRFRILVGCILLCLTSLPCANADVTLNGYTFSSDSTELWGNPYFSEFSRTVDIEMVLHGYGGFSGSTIILDFHQTMTVGGIECDVFNEEGYYPAYDPDSSSFSMDYYNGYVSYAKDVEDNIHILSMALFMPFGDVGWSYADLSQVGTTLLYPASPATGQAVFGGHVEGTGVQVGDSEDCVTIFYDSLPQYPSRTVTAYLSPAAGVLALSYNWEGKKNGFSSSGTAPEDEEESKSTFEEWKDDHCFISACSF